MIQRLFSILFFLCSFSLQALTVSLENPLELNFADFLTASKEDKSKKDSGLPIHPSSGVAWYSNDEYLVVANFYESLIEIFKFDESSKSFSKVQSVSSQEDKNVGYPIDVTVSDDNKWMAVTNYGSRSGVCVYKIDPETSMIDPKPIATVQAHGRTHGVEFSPEGKFLAFTVLSDEGKVCVLENKNYKGKTPNFVVVKEIAAKGEKLLPKAVTFSKDNHFFIAAYSPSILGKPGIHKEKGCIDVYSINSEDFSFSKDPIFSTGSIAAIRGCEDVVFTLDGMNMILTLTPYDEMVMANFDSSTGHVGEIVPFLNNPSASLKEPHGFSFSSNGKYLAVTKNEGEGIITVYELEE